jgi:hypothetical protein
MHLLCVYVYILHTDLHAYIRTPWLSAYVVVRENDGAREMLVLLAPQAGLSLRHAAHGVPGVRGGSKQREAPKAKYLKTAVNVELGVVLGEHEWAIV